MCTEHKLLFNDTSHIKLAEREWIRFLPVFMKTQSDRQPTNPTKEVELPNNEERFNIMGPLGPPCNSPIESYGTGDEEKKACGLRHLQKSDVQSSSRCVVYSIGSNNEWGFEEAIFNTTSCRVETFDCTINSESLPPEYIRSRVRFHHICLGDTDEGLFRKWKSLSNLTGHVGAPTFLKMDIEGYEFPVMRDIIDSGESLPLQIAMELHTERMEKDNPQDKPYYKTQRHVGSLELFSFMNYLRIFGGYYLIDRKDKVNGLCAEILLARLDCQSHPLDSKNPYSEIKKQTYQALRNKIDVSMRAKYYGR